MWTTSKAGGSKQVIRVVTTNIDPIVELSGLTYLRVQKLSGDATEGINVLITSDDVDTGGTFRIQTNKPVEFNFPSGFSVESAGNDASVFMFYGSN